MSNVKNFSLADVLTTYTGYLVSPRGIDAAYDVTEHLAGPGITTLGLLYLKKAVNAELERQHPILKKVGTPPWAGRDGEVTQDECTDWVTQVAAQLGVSSFDIEEGDIRPEDVQDEMDRVMGSIGSARRN